MRKTTGFYMRLIHRYLGFFLAGIMAVYAFSGVILIYRSTDLLKKEVVVKKTIKPQLSAQELGKELHIRGLKVTETNGAVLYYKGGEYNTSNGNVTYTEKKLPFLIEKMTKLHKATTNSPLYWLNIFFGASLLFFVLSSFWMFLPKTTVFKKGLLYTLGGVILTLVLLFV